jgi:uncharacterized membrane protein YphA (DoxX/SURF4 family)
MTEVNNDAVAFLLRAVLGTFYVLARFRFFYDPARSPRFCNPERHQSLTNKVKHCGWYSMPYFWAWFVAAAEVLGGLALIVGLLTVPAAAGLLIVTLFATYCTARDKVMEQHPVDALDCVGCYLWRVEGIYIAIALAIVLLGPGRWSLDYLWSLL